jgi:endonuclease/exonuclease/phosphatase family metal-dependent hydrolase
MILYTLSGIILLVLILLLVLTLTEYKPPLQQQLHAPQETLPAIIGEQGLHFMIWNTGYAGLGQEMDFFYDGGQMVRPDRTTFQFYSDKQLSFIRSIDSLDFILWQEVDKTAKRSYFTNQKELITEVLSGHSALFATNYKAPFVPLPLAKPMGKVESGLMSISAYQPLESLRVAFMGNFSWPTRLFMLKRCFIMQRFKTNFGGDLIVINTHNSAFDDGDLRKEQMNVLREYALIEYNAGNYVIVAGDWNMNPPGFKADNILNGDLAVGNPLNNIPDDFMPSGWQWAYDPSLPTNRYLDMPYRKGTTRTTIVDFFLISPNVTIETIKTIDSGFEYSDHNPVYVAVKLTGR